MLAGALMDAPTLSPGALSQVVILPSVMVDDRAGMKTSLTALVMPARLPCFTGTACCLLCTRGPGCRDESCIAPHPTGYLPGKPRQGATL